MENIKTKIQNVVPYMIICIAVFTGILILNRMTIYTGDDYMYRFFFVKSRPEESTRMLEKISEIPSSLWNHYHNWNARIVAHAFVQFFMLFDKILFDLCNSLVFLIVGFLLLLHIEADGKKWNPSWLAMVYLSMWFFFPHFGLSVLWLSGSCNYLWMCALQLWFLYYFKKYTDYPEREKGLWRKNILMIFLGFLSGWSNENSGGATILLSILFVTYWIWNKKKVPVWSIGGVLTSCIGFMFLLMAPSSTSRIGSSFLEAGVFLKRLREFCGFSFRYLFLLCIVLLGIVVCFVKKQRETKEDWIKPMMIPFCYCLSGAASVVVLIASPVISGKSWLWAVCFVMIAIGLLLKNGIYKRYCSRLWVKTVILLFCICAGVRYINAWKDIFRTYQEKNIQIEQLQEQKEDGKMDVSVSLLTPSDNLYNAISRTPNLDKDASAWFNQCMAFYYHVYTIEGVEAGYDSR